MSIAQSFSYSNFLTDLWKFIGSVQWVLTVWIENVVEFAQFAGKKKAFVEIRYAPNEIHREIHQKQKLPPLIFPWNFNKIFFNKINFWKALICVPYCSSKQTVDLLKTLKCTVNEILHGSQIKLKYSTNFEEINSNVDFYFKYSMESWPLRNFYQK